MPTMPGVIIACTGQGGSKELVYRAVIQHGLGDIPVGVALPHKVPEVRFNAVLATRPDLVAILKILQHAGHNPDAMVRGIFGTRARQLTSSQILLCATDVTLGTCRLHDQNWKIHNKPDIQAGMQSIYDALIRQFYDWTYAQLRVGCAAYGPIAGRGMAGVTKDILLMRPIPPEVIRDYVYGGTYTRYDLGQTNFAVRWENPAFAQYVDTLNGISWDDPEFPLVWDDFISRATGVPRDIGSLLSSTAQFQQSSSRGDLTSTVLREASTYGLHCGGVWETWYPPIDTQQKAQKISSSGVIYDGS